MKTDKIDHRSQIHNLSSCELVKKHSGLDGIRTHDLCDTGVVLWSYSSISKITKVSFQGSLCEKSKLVGFSDSAHRAQFLPYRL